MFLKEGVVRRIGHRTRCGRAIDWYFPVAIGPNDRSATGDESTGVAAGVIEQYNGCPIRRVGLDTEPDRRRVLGRELSRVVLWVRCPVVDDRRFNGRIASYLLADDLAVVGTESDPLSQLHRGDNCALGGVGVARRDRTVDTEWSVDRGERQRQPAHVLEAEPRRYRGQ